MTTPASFINILWNWSKKPTTAESLVVACDEHIARKQKDAERALDVEQAKRQAWSTAQARAEEGKSIWDNRAGELERTFQGMRDRLKTLRDAINVALEEDTKETAFDSFCQVCTMATECDAEDFCRTVKETRANMERAETSYHALDEARETAEGAFKNAEGDRQLADQHLQEIRHIKAQLSERLSKETKTKKM